MQVGECVITGRFQPLSIEVQAALIERHELETLLFCPNSWALRHRFIKTETGEIVRARCGSWSCLYCGPRKVDMWRQLVKAAEPTLFITLTQGVGASGAYVKVFGKGRKEREIGLHPEVGKLLWKYIQKHRHPTNRDETALFIGRYGEPLQIDGVRGLLNRVKKASGIEGFRVSAHTFAKFYLQRGGEVFKFSREMGHSTVQVTEIYLKDYRGSEARREHTSNSPIAEIDSVGKKRRRKKKEQ